MAQAHKKRKSEASSVLNAHPLHPEMEDKVQLIRIITRDTESESGTWFWNDSANESGSDTEEGEENNNENESDSFS